MTQEEQKQLQTMTTREIVRKYLPMKISGALRQDAYIWLLKQAKDYTEVKVEKEELDTVLMTPTSGSAQKDRLFSLLSDNQWHSTIEIMQKVYDLGDRRGISRIAARIYDLKREGHNIESRSSVGSLWEYRLTPKV